MDRERILSDIRKLVGGKRIEFNDYDGSHVVGIHDIPYWGVTKTYLYIYCFAYYSYDENKGEYGMILKKYPLFKSVYGKNVDKVKLEDLFTDDLEKVLNSLKEYFKWMAEEHFNEVEKKYKECMEIKNKWNKFNKENK